MALWVSGSCRRLRNEAYGLRIVCFIYVAFRTIGAQGWWRSDVTRVTDGLSRPGNVPVTRATKRGSFSAENGRNTGTRQLWEELKLHQNPSAPIILQLAIRHAACKYVTYMGLGYCACGGDSSCYLNWEIPIGMSATAPKTRYCTISTYSSALVTCDHHEEMRISSAKFSGT
jgi:hypothetical protein